MPGMTGREEHCPRCHWMRTYQTVTNRRHFVCNGKSKNTIITCIVCIFLLGPAGDICILSQHETNVHFWGLRISLSVKNVIITLIDVLLGFLLIWAARKQKWFTILLSFSVNLFWGRSGSSTAAPDFSVWISFKSRPYLFLILFHQTRSCWSEGKRFSHTFIFHHKILYFLSIHRERYNTLLWGTYLQNFKHDICSKRLSYWQCPHQCIGLSPVSSTPWPCLWDHPSWSCSDGIFFSSYHKRRNVLQTNLKTSPLALLWRETKESSSC